MPHTIDLNESLSTINRFISGQLMRSGLEGFVVGLSGGIDSALSATLAVRAVGIEKVHGVLLPYKSSSPGSITDAKALAEQLQIEYEVVEISPMIDAYYDKITPEMRVRAGNKMARERMAVLFDLAHKMNRLVLGTGNRTEVCLGYTTLFGDAACSLNPIGQLYKTEVRRLSKELGVPEAILTKAPSADLWTDQTDEGEIGVTYETIDRILERIVDDGERSMAKLEAEGYLSTDISRVVSLINRNAFKRRMPDIAPLGRAAVPDDIILAE